jgi:uncharacterized protein YjbI with pentapeptide repeats
MELEKAELE